MSTGFRCKQFYVEHGDCAMKVSTDALILGAWTAVPATGSVLDIGAGTGILSLMLAQRAAAVRVDAIELDAVAAHVARQNFTASRFSARLRLFQGDILTYPRSPDYRSEQRYDLIISNPPFFQDGIKSKEPTRQRARHTDSLPFPDLLQVAAQCIQPTGIFSLVLPCVEAKLLLDYAQATQWQLIRQCTVYSIPAKPIRTLLTLQRVNGVTDLAPISEQLVIRQHDGQYSAEYRTLLRDFYLKF